MIEVTADPKPLHVFVVQPREESGVTMKPRLIRATKVSKAQDYLLQAFEVRKPSPEELLQLGAEGVQIEDPSA